MSLSSKAKIKHSKLFLHFKDILFGLKIYYAFSQQKHIPKLTFLKSVNIDSMMYIYIYINISIVVTYRKLSALYV